MINRFKTSGIAFKTSGRRLVSDPGKGWGGFISSWNTANTSTGSSNADQVSLPLVSVGSYNFKVNWGDNSESTITAYNQAEVTHTYAAQGTYTIHITGTCYGWQFNNGGDRLKILNISKWGDAFRVAPTDTNAGHFYGCSNLTLTATDALDLTGATSALNMFRSCSAMTSAPTMSLWNTASITNMQAMFHTCTLFNQDLSGFNTSNVTNMPYMLVNCSNFNSPVPFSTAKVTTMEGMFGGCAKFNQSVATFNTSACTRTLGMFQNCAAFNQSVANFDTSKVTTMNGMFQGCTVFNQPVSTFNTSNVTDMAGMFQSCAAFKEDLSGFNVAKVTTASNMMASSNINDTGTTMRYDALLNAWAAQTVLASVPFHAGTAKYSSAASAARATLVAAGWSITDGGLGP